MLSAKKPSSIAGKIGGYTGDTLGAIEQKAEIVFLVVVALFIAH